jgi:two-component system, LytTR family, response regulator
MDGLEVARNLLGSPLPKIVIVAAYDQHAIQAFDRGAIDYLLKPISETQLQTCIDSAKRMINWPGGVADQIAQIASINIPSSPAKNSRVVGCNGPQYILLDTGDVIAFQARGVVVWIITGKERFLAIHSLQKIEERVGKTPFQRIHKNAIININHLCRFTRLSSQRWTVTMSNELQLTVSKRYGRGFRRQLLKWP